MNRVTDNVQNWDRLWRSPSTTKQQLMTALDAKYALRTKTLEINNLALEITRPKDPEDVLDEETIERSHDELPWQPYWAQAWDSAIGMAAYLQGRDIKNRSLLDLGCSLGISGAAALDLGARVLLGDNAPPALAFARLNTWPWRDRAAIDLIDWNQTRLTKMFDLIVGSDILYDRNDIVPLDRFFRTHLCLQGHVVLSDPTRLMTDELLNRLEFMGWNVRSSQLDCPGIDRPIRIVEMHPS